MNSRIILKVLDILLLGASLVPDARRAGEALARRLRQFGDRDPTAEEVAALDRDTDALLRGLAARAEEARRRLDE